MPDKTNDHDATPLEPADPHDPVRRMLATYGAAVERSVEPVRPFETIGTIGAGDDGPIEAGVVHLAGRAARPARRAPVPMILAVAATLIVGLLLARVTIGDRPSVVAGPGSTLPGTDTSAPPPVVSTATTVTNVPGFVDQPLAGPRWTLRTSDGQAPFAPLRSPYLVLGPGSTATDGLAFGHDGCNGVSGTLRAEGSTLHFSPFVGTLIGCIAPPGRPPGPTLPSGDVNYAIDGATMTVTFDGHTLVYEALNASPDGTSPIVTRPVEAPDSPRMTALFHGTVTFDRSTGCVTIGWGAAAWPAGTTWQASPPAVVLADGTVLPEGSAIEAGGGYVPTDGLDQSVLDQLERCGGATDVQIIDPILQSDATTTVPTTTGSIAPPAP